VESEVQLPADGISGPLGENLYRIAQEALSNVAQHAGTDRARLSLSAGPDGIELAVEDSGRGFDPALLPGSGRLGVLGMRERTELLGGTFTLETAPGRGTRIAVRLPPATG